MLLTPEQLYEIQKIIAEHHSAFMANTIGPEVIPPDVLKELKAKGLIKEPLNTIGEAYTYGQLLGTLETKNIAKMTYGEFKNHVRNNPVPLTAVERGAMAMAAQNAAQYCRGLGNRVDLATGAILIEADRKLRAKIEEDIRDATEENIAKRETVQQLQSDLGWATEDWARDLKRIAVTEKVTAMNQGTSDHYKKRYGPDTLVAKRAMPDSCFIAGTLVKTKRGDIPIEQVQIGDKVLTHKLRWKKVTYLFKNYYEGYLYGFNGSKPHTTENHPILTDLDWRRADSIQVGSYVVEVRNVNVPQYDPSLSSKDKFFLNVSSTGTSSRMPISSVQLYSYLQMRNSNIDVKFVDSKFQNGFELCQKLNQGKGVFGSTRKSTLSSLGSSTLGFPRECFFTSYSSVVEKLLSFFVGHTFESCPLAIGWSGYGYVPKLELSKDNAPRDFKIFPQRGHRVFTGIPQFKAFFFRNIFSWFHKAKIVANARRVNTIAKDYFTGFVYNLEVEKDNSYVANDLIVHNCPHCQRLHNGPNGPRVFKLSTLEAHGTNVGRKTADWRAVVGSTHPNCQCVMIRIPVGWGWDEFGNLVPGGKIDLYESPEDLALAMLQEDDLQKGFALQDHVLYQGIPIAIENKKGSIRRWTDVTGATGETKFQGVSYGYIQGTVGADGDCIDVFVGPDPRAKLVYCIEQQNPYTGVYDEQKCFLGFPSQQTAETAYRLHYDNPDKFFITTESMDVEQFKRWIALTKPQGGELVKSGKLDAIPRDLSLVILIPDEDLEKGKKGVAIGGKYIKRVPYNTKEGTQKYRYFYAESAAARDVKAGETVKLGPQYATVKAIDTDGSIHLEIGSTNIKVAANQWDNLLATHYGSAYFKWAEKRSSQSVDAVLKHVPKEELLDLKGTTDEERLADLKVRVPKVYEKLQKSFSRAGINPFRAKHVLASSLERKGWEPEARAAVIGNVITKRNQDYRTTIRAAENLAGGSQVKLGHVAAITHIVQQVQNTEKDEIAEIAVRAEKELAKLSALLAKAQGGTDEDKATMLATALSSHAIQQLNVIAQAFPGLRDKAVEPARQIMLEVPSAVPKAVPKAVGSSTTVFVAGEGGQPKALKAKFKLVEADSAIASHDPNNFSPRTDYPTGLQERAYHRDKAEQAKVQRNAQKLRPEFVVNTNPDAVNGAPILGPDGVVLGGNSRTMSMQLVYSKHPEKAKELKDYLAEHAHEAGFTKEDVEQFKNPILVREVEDGGKTKEDKQLLVRQMNESFTQSMDPRTLQVALGRKITDASLTELGNSMDPEETLSEFLVSNRAEGFINSLQKAGVIDQRNSNAYFLKNSKKLNPDGVTLVARVLVGRTIGDADLLSATLPSVVENLAVAVPYIAQAKTYGEGYDLSKDLNVALEAYNGLQYRVTTKAIPALTRDMTDERFGKLFNQQEMFGGAHPVTANPRAMDLLEILIRRPGPTQMSKFFKDYADEAKKNPEDQASMFAKKTPTAIVHDLKDKHIKLATEEKAAKEKKKKEKEAKETKENEGGLFRSWGYFVGPKGGKWKDPEHTIPWEEPAKKPARKTLGKPGEGSTDVKPLPGQINIYDYVYKIKKNKVEKSQQGGPYIGPRGGKWADPEHTIPWQADMPTGKAPVTEKEKSKLHGKVVRPIGWGVVATDVHALFDEWSKRKNSAWRGMTQDEYENTVAKGKGVKSSGKHSLATEGTQFSDHPGDAESYVNFGRDDPRKTGKPTYMVEVRKEGLHKKPDSYWETKPGEGVDHKDILSIHKMYTKDGAIVAEDVDPDSIAKAPSTPSSQTDHIESKVRELTGAKHDFNVTVLSEKDWQSKFPSDATDRLTGGTSAITTPEGKVFVRQGYEDSIAHELIHLAGTHPKGVSDFINEGLTQAFAEDVNKELGIQYRPTYNDEVNWVKTNLLPLVGPLKEFMPEYLKASDKGQYIADLVMDKYGKYFANKEDWGSNPKEKFAKDLKSHVGQDPYTTYLVKEVIKSLSVEIAGISSPAGNRAPGPGLGINYVIFVPAKKTKKERANVLVGKEDLVDPLMEEAIGALYVDKDDYDFTEQQRNLHPYELPDEFLAAHTEAREETDKRMDYVKNEPIKNAPRPKNKVEVE